MTLRINIAWFLCVVIHSGCCCDWRRSRRRWERSHTSRHCQCHSFFDHRRFFASSWGLINELWHICICSYCTKQAHVGIIVCRQQIKMACDIVKALTLRRKPLFLDLMTTMKNDVRERASERNFHIHIYNYSSIFVELFFFCLKIINFVSIFSVQIEKIIASWPKKLAKWYVMFHYFTADVHLLLWFFYCCVPITRSPPRIFMDG